MLKSYAIEVATRYAKSQGISVNVENEMGGGTDGWVWESYRPSAVKVIERKANYNIELECYQRLKKNGIKAIRRFRVPQLVAFNDELQVVEMTIVNKPFLIDFAKSHLDIDPEFSEDKWRIWNEEGIEDFGEERWREAKIIVAALKRFGIYYYDVSRANLMFEDWPEDDD